MAGNQPVRCIVLARPVLRAALVWPLSAGAIAILRAKHGQRPGQLLSKHAFQLRRQRWPPGIHLTACSPTPRFRRQHSARWWVVDCVRHRRFRGRTAITRRSSVVERATVYLTPVSVELGINFSHIQAKSSTVLNPLRRIDEHIMDDADLAGPLLFVFCFAAFLLLVRRDLLSSVLPLTHLSVGQDAVWIYLWCRPPRGRFDLHPAEPDVRARDRCLPRHVGAGLLSPAYGRCRCYQCHDHSEVRLLLTWLSSLC